MVLRPRALHKAGTASRTETPLRGGRVPGLQIPLVGVGLHLLQVYGAPSLDASPTILPGHSPRKTLPPLLGALAPPHTNARLSAVKGSPSLVWGWRGARMW